MKTCIKCKHIEYCEFTVKKAESCNFYNPKWQPLSEGLTVLGGALMVVGFVGIIYLAVSSVLKQ